jgi:hypothetical protein
MSASKVEPSRDGRTGILMLALMRNGGIESVKDM